MNTKAEIKKQFRALLEHHGFKQEGNYYRRKVANALQALYLQPSRWGHIYYPEMLISYSDLNPKRNNTQADCHLSARLSSYFHPKFDPRMTPCQEWCISYDLPDGNPVIIKTELQNSLTTFLKWSDEYPTWEIAADKMHSKEHATWINRFRLFEDVGRPVPMPIQG